MSIFGRRENAGLLPTFSEGRLPGFEGARGWFNSEPLTAEGLRGKVVLVDFWTYTCINWLRTLGYVRAWAEKYRELGLVVVGVHTPEFPFEHDADNVEQAIKEMNVDYPVALDPDFAVWDAFGNRYWPAVYIVDAEGRIRHHQFGEGGYDECELEIQRLLREAGSESVPDDLVSVVPTGLEAQADWDSLGSPETYLGYGQGGTLASPGGVAADQAHTYELPDPLKLNHWALSGDWTIERGGIVSNEAGGTIAFRFHARDANLVLRSRTGAPVPFQVSVDGEGPGNAHGLDVDEQGRGTLGEPRLYQLVREPGPIGDRTLEVVFDAPGAEAYVFTFG
jgi:thiol-disulfide isomerase/thioredoxin